MNFPNPHEFTAQIKAADPEEWESFRDVLFWEFYREGYYPKLEEVARDLIRNSGYSPYELWHVIAIKNALHKEVASDIAEYAASEPEQHPDEENFYLLAARK